MRIKATPENADDLLLTPLDASRVLGLSPEMVRVHIDKGHLRCLLTVGGRRLLRRAEVERFAAQRRARAA